MRLILQLHMTFLVFKMVFMDTCLVTKNLTDLNGRIEVETSDSEMYLCSWRILVPKGYIPTVRVSNFPFNSSCNENFLQINDQLVCRINQTNLVWIWSAKDVENIMVVLKLDVDFEFVLDYSMRKMSVCNGFDFKCTSGGGCFNQNQYCDYVFDCVDHSDEAGCECLGAACGSDGCFDTNERCDGVLQCPQGEDEVGCTKRCPNSIKCGNYSACVESENICNKNIDCPNAFDELVCCKGFLCKNGRCIGKDLVNDGIDDCGDNSDEQYKIFLVLISFLGPIILLFVSFICLIMYWFSKRRNVGYLMQNPPEFPLPPFRAPGETANRRLQMSDSDFMLGGDVYEAFVRTRRTMAQRRHRRISSETPAPIPPNNYIEKLASPAALALISLGITPNMCVGLIKDDKIEEEMPISVKVSSENCDVKEMSEEEIENINGFECTSDAESSS